MNRKTIFPAFSSAGIQKKGNPGHLREIRAAAGKKTQSVRGMRAGVVWVWDFGFVYHAGFDAILQDAIRKKSEEIVLYFY